MTSFLPPGVMYGFKGLILVFGLFLAYETRSLKVKQINDSRYVGMSIYNVVILCLITAPVAMVIASQQDASFAFVALAVIFCCFLSMLLIFVPKVIFNLIIVKDLLNQISPFQVIEVIRHPKDKAESKYNPDAGISKEDEERYQKLVTENDDLQKLISQVTKRALFYSGSIIIFTVVHIHSHTFTLQWFNLIFVLFFTMLLRLKDKLKL